MDGAIFNDLEWLSEASCGLSATAELLVAKHQSYIGHAHDKTIHCVVDNIIVDVFKIICWCEPTDSFMVNVICRGIAGAQGFTAGARAPAAPLPWRHHWPHCVTTVPLHLLAHTSTKVQTTTYHFLAIWRQQVYRRRYESRRSPKTKMH